MEGKEKIEKSDESTKESLVSELKKMRIQAYNHAMNERNKIIQLIGANIKNEFFDNAQMVANSIIEDLKKKSLDYSEELNKKYEFSFSGPDRLKSDLKSFKKISSEIVNEVVEALLNGEEKLIYMIFKDYVFYFSELSKILNEKGIGCEIVEKYIFVRPIIPVESYEDDYSVTYDSSTKRLEMKYKKI